MPIGHWSTATIVWSIIVGQKSVELEYIYLISSKLT